MKPEKSVSRLRYRGSRDSEATEERPTRDGAGFFRISVRAVLTAAAFPADATTRRLPHG